MFLPSNLQHSIEELLKETKSKELKSSSAHITEQYRAGKSLYERNALLAYLTVRMPSTYAAIYSVLSQIPHPITSLLDLGSGPGTGWWAASSLWPNFHTTCIEREATFIELGKKLGCPHYIQGDIEKLTSYPHHDLALFGYSLGELQHFDFEPLWSAVDSIAIVEPGTPRGFATILEARKKLIDLGGHVLAPCPHSQACPHPTWCHFSVRVERSYLHREAKQASLPYEDEKYSYVIVTKEPLNRSHPRILSNPGKHGGHVSLELCTVNGIERQIVSKKQKELYKQARKAKWGDLLNSETH